MKQTETCLNIRSSSFPKINGSGQREERPEMKKEQPLPSTTLTKPNEDTNNQAQKQILNPIFDDSSLNPTTDLHHIDQLIGKGGELTEELADRVIDLSSELPDIQFLVEKNGIGCIPVGDIVVMKGKAKAGKSTVITIWVTALLSGDFMGFKALKQGCTVLYIDTEQNPANTRRLTKKVHQLCGYSTKVNHPNFIVINLRGDNPKDRNKYIDEAISKFNPDLLIIDGAKDLISSGDINDIKSCVEVVQRMMTISKDNNLAIITILHENKNDTNLRGHIGTELLNKCAESWQVTKNGENFEVKQEDYRNQPAEGFSFTLDDDVLPVSIERVPKISFKERTRAKKVEAFRICLPPLTNLPYTELARIYCKLYPCKIDTAKKDIASFCKDGYLTHEPDGNYRYNYQKT